MKNIFGFSFLYFIYGLVLISSIKSISYLNNKKVSFKVLPVNITSSIIVDVNNDGLNDIILGHENYKLSNNLLLLNKGNYFQIKHDAFPPYYLGKWGLTVNFAKGDFNNDGKIDIISTTVDGRKHQFYSHAMIHYYEGDGNGFFVEKKQNTKMFYKRWIEWIRVGDFNKDNNLDFLITDAGTNNVNDYFGGRIYRGDGKGDFEIATIKLEDNNDVYESDLLWWKYLGYQDIYTGMKRYALDVFIGDIDKDGDIDLVSPGGYMAGVMASFINESHKNEFRFKIVYSDIREKNKTPHSTVPLKNGLLVDINQDGFLDIIGSSTVSENFGKEVETLVYENIKNGSFNKNEELLENKNLGKHIHARQWIKIDYKKDGIEDVVLAGHGKDASPHIGEANKLFVNNGKALMVSEALKSGIAFSHGVSVGDLNGDGLEDIFFNDGKPIYYSQKKDGSFVPEKLNIQSN